MADPRGDLLERLYEIEGRAPPRPPPTASGAPAAPDPVAAPPPAPRDLLERLREIESGSPPPAATPTPATPRLATRSEPLTGPALADVEEQGRRIVAEVPTWAQGAARVFGLPSTGERLLAAPGTPRGRRLAKTELVKRGISPGDEDPADLLRRELRREILDTAGAEQIEAMLKQGKAPEGHRLAAELGVVRRLIVEAGGTTEDGGIPLARAQDGTVGLDEVDARRRIYQKTIDDLRETNPGWEDDLDLAAKLDEEAKRRAAAVIARARAVGAGLPFVTPNVLALREKVLDLPESIRPLAALLIPRFDVVQTGNVTKTASLGSSPTSYYGRMAGSTFLGALIHTADEGEVADVIATAALEGAKMAAPVALGPVGTVAASMPAVRDALYPEQTLERLNRPESTDFLMTGGDIFTEAGKLSRAIRNEPGMAPARWVTTPIVAGLGALGMSEAWQEEAPGYLAAIATILVEPDPASLVVGPAGKAIMGVFKGAALARKMGKIEAVLARVADEVGVGGDLAKMVDALDKVSPALSNLFVLQVGKRLGLKPGVAERLTSTILPKLRKLEDVIGAARAQIVTLQRTHAPEIARVQAAVAEVRRLRATIATLNAHFGRTVPPVFRPRMAALRAELKAKSAIAMAERAKIKPVFDELAKHRRRIADASKLHQKWLTKPIRDEILSVGAGRDLTPGTDADAFVRRTFAEVARGFEASSKMMRDALKAGGKLPDTPPAGAEEAWTTLYSIARDHSIPASGIIGRLSKMVKRTKAAWSPRTSKRGVFAPAVHEVAEGVINQFDSATDEVASLIAHRGRRIGVPRAIFDYVDKTDAFELERGVSWVNVGTASLWQKAQGAILTQIAEVEAAGEGLEKVFALQALSRMWAGGGPGVVPPSESAELLAAAARLIRTAPTYEAFSAEMRRATGRIGKVDARIPRSLSHGMMAVFNAAFLRDAATELSRKIGAPLTEVEARSANAVLLREAPDIEDWNAALRTLARLGMPFGASAKTTEEFGEASRKLIRIYTDTEGASHFLPANVVKEMEAATGKITRELVPYAEEIATAGDAARAAARGWYSLVKASLVIGLGVPKLAYTFANTGIADLSAIWWSHEGLGAALRTGMQTLPAQAPLYGRIGQWWQAGAERAAGGVPVLGSAVAAMFDPNVSKVFTGAADEVVEIAGRRIKLADLRQTLVKDGVMGTEAGAEFHRLVHRLSSDGPFAWATWWQREIAKHNVVVQQRQRVALYLDILRRGASPEEAATRTKAALYDYKHGFAQAEMNVLARFDIPFYRWWKLALTQAATSYLEPLVLPAGETAKRAVMGRTMMARGRQQVQLMRAFQSWAIDAEHEGEQSNMSEEIMRMGGVMAPGWREGNVWIPRSADEAERMWGDRSPTHFMQVFPNATAISAIHFTMTVMTGLATLGAYAATHSYAAATDGDANFELAPGFWKSFLIEPFSGLMGPAWEEVLLPLLGASDREDGLVYARPDEARMIAAFAALPYSPIDKPLIRDGRAYVRPGLLRLMKVIPGLVQVPAYIRAANNPAFERSWGEGMAQMGLDVLGLRKEYGFSAPGQMERNQREGQQQLRQAADDYGTPRAR